MLRQYFINTPKKFVVNGEEKTQWLPVGSMRILDNGQIFIQMNQTPDTTFMAFEKEEKPKQPAQNNTGDYIQPVNNAEVSF